jgi:DNA-binding response OmpR family regulator
MRQASILIADDEPRIRFMVRSTLSDGQYQIEEAGNGIEVLEAVQKNPPDLIILDLAMPAMDGMTALTELQLVDRQRPIRVIVMTAHGSVQTAIKALRLGASDFIEKPFVPEDLRLSVASVLEDTPHWLMEAGEGYDQVLQQIRKALRERRFAAAESLLMKAGAIADDDPGFLNLAGVLHESHGRVNSALRFYERAAMKEIGGGPAHDNITRLEELRRMGRSPRAVALGKEAEFSPDTAA